MNLLSAISIVIFTSFFIGAVAVLKVERKSVLNIFASVVLSCLGWWSFCNSFFFASENVQQAWFWHKLSSIGWCGFVACTVYYFVALTNSKKRIMVLWKQFLFFVPPVVLIFKNLFGKTTSLAQNIIMSKNGWGWTYENSVTSLWFWIYVIYVFSYFGFAFYLLYKWSKSVKHKMKKELAIGFIILDAITILLGVITDAILPLTYPVLPAMANIATAFFGIGYFGIVHKYDVFNINLIVSSDDILQTSNNPLFVIDENKEILKCNNAANNLLGYGKKELTGLNFMSFVKADIDLNSLSSCDDLQYAESKIHCSNGEIKDILISASIAKDKKNNFLCTIVSCQDVSKQKKIQEELKIQQKNYKKLANDYQKLAYFDPLTELPNRRHFFDVLGAFEELYKKKNKDFVILFMDLDNFKYANDVHGHKFGDELLKLVANKLKNCLEDDELVSRLGGDEFIIIMPYDGTNVENKINRINEEFQKDILIEGHLYEVRISIGYCIYSEVCDITKLMQKADDEMYENKRKKKQI